MTFTIPIASLVLIGISLALFLLATAVCVRYQCDEADVAILTYGILWLVPSLIMGGTWLVVYLWGAS